MVMAEVIFDLTDDDIEKIANEFARVWKELDEEEKENK
jgi:hypothetical protein